MTYFLICTKEPYGFNELSELLKLNITLSSDIIISQFQLPS